MDWKALGDFLPTSSLLMLTDLPSLIDNDSQDCLYWRFDSTRKVTLASTHSLLSNLNDHDKDENWNLIWRWSGLQQMKTFLSLANHDRVLMNVE